VSVPVSRRRLPELPQPEFFFALSKSSPRKKVQ